MTNRLSKVILESYTEGTPGQAGRPGQAAYNLFRWSTVCKYRGLQYVWAQDSDGVFRNIPIYPPGATIGPYECGPGLIQEWQQAIPEVPTVPAGAYQVTRDFRLGWNAGAGSIKYFDRNGIARFVVSPGTVGVVCGLARERPVVSRDNIASRRYLDIEHGFYVTKTIARVVEKGAILYYAGDVGANATYAILRIDGLIYYIINGGCVWVSAASSNGRYHMLAVLYSGGDYVDNPSMEDVIVMSPMECKGKENTTSEVSPFTRGVTERLTLLDQCVGTLPTSGYVSFEPMECNGGVGSSATKGIMQFEAL